MFNNIKIERIGLDINKILKITYNEDCEDEKKLFYNFDIYVKSKWEGEVFDIQSLIDRIKKDLNK